MTKRSRAAALWSIGLLMLGGGAAADYVVRTSAGQTHQTIEGWGASLAHWSPEARALYAGDAFRHAFRDLGLNILRVDMQKEVLVASDTDFKTPVRLGGDLAANLARMDFHRPAIATFGELARWLRVNALEPDRVRVSGALWTPPHWMKGPTRARRTYLGRTPRIPTPFLSNEHLDPGNPVANGDSVGGRLRTEDASIVDQYGKYIAAWVKGFEQAYGVEMYAISLQNESTFENPFNSMTLATNARGRNDFTQYATALASVKKAWGDFGVNARVMGPHVANFGTATNPSNLWKQNQMIGAVRNHDDKTLIDFLDYYNANFYNSAGENAVKAVAGFYHGGDAVDAGLDWGNRDYGRPPGVKNDGKGIWYSETGGEGGGWPGAIEVALKMHVALVHSNASAYVYWQLADGDAEVSEHTLVGSADIGHPLSSKKYAAFKQFSRYIRPGAVRLEAGFENGGASVGGASRYDPRHSVNVSAYWEEGEGRLTYVLINARPHDERITVALPDGFTLEALQAFRTSATESFEALGGIEVVDGALTYTAPGRSVTTLTGLGE